MNYAQKQTAANSAVAPLEKFIKTLSAGDFSAQNIEDCQQAINDAKDEITVLAQFCSKDDPSLLHAQELVNRANNILNNLGPSKGIF